MITTGGSSAIGNTLAQSLGASIAVGIGSSTPQASDTRLDFEVFRAPVRVRNYDAATNRLVLAASLPESLDVTIAEVGVYTTNASSSGLMTTFDEVAEAWTGGTWNSTNARMGNAALALSGASATMDGGSSIALSNIRQSDIFQVAAFGAGGTVEVRVRNSDTDYYRYTFAPAAGYNVSSAPVSSLAKVGNPDLSSVTSLHIIHSGTGSVQLDGIRIHVPEEDESLIIRQKFTTPWKKTVGMPLDIEVPLEINL